MSPAQRRNAALRRRARARRAAFASAWIWLLSGCTVQHRQVVRDTAALLEAAADLAETACVAVDDVDACAARCLEQARAEQ